MNPEIFSEWLRRQGRVVVRTKSSYWHSEGLRAFQAFPYHWTIEPSETETRGLLREKKAICLRYSTPVEAPIGRSSYHAVLETRSYDIDGLGKWARKNVRRGLRNCAVEEISFDRLAREGFDLQRDTLDRQGRSAKRAKENWPQICRAAAELPGFTAWGALVQGRLAASVITFLMNDCCYMLYQQCHRDFLTAHVNNALSFTVTRAMIRREDVRSVFYSLQSLDAPASMDEFKFRMGYSAKAVRQRVLFHPAWAPVFHPLTHAIVKTMKSLWPGNPLLAKSEGMIRFYLEGKKPLARQPGSMPWQPSPSEAEALPDEPA